MWLAGVDGCRGGWFRAARHTATGELRFDVIQTASGLLMEPPVPAILALDMPIGLPERGSRACDIAARALLGPRRSSVFPAPIRPALAARTHEQASRATAAADGRRVSAQAFNLFAKIRELDALLRADPEARRRIREVHPELSFRAWNGGRPMTAAKKKPVGRRERIALVESWLGPDLLARARGVQLRAQLADDDILDAVAALWTAHRVAEGCAETLPDPPERDGAGLPMEIVC